MANMLKFMAVLLWNKRSVCIDFDKVMRDEIAKLDGAVNVWPPAGKLAWCRAGFMLWCMGLVLAVSASMAVAQKADEPDYVNTWMVLGTFDNDAHGTAFQESLIDESATAIDPQKEVAGKRWNYFDDRLFSRNYDNYQDLWSYFKTKLSGSVNSKVAYVHTYVYSETAQPVQLYVGADERSRVWVNGQQVLESAPGQWKRDSVVKAAQLNQGWNNVLLKIGNDGDRRFGFYLRIADGRGNRVKGLTWSVQGPAGDLKVATESMKDAGTGDMPIAWREWSYVSARPDIDAIYPRGSEADEKRWIMYSFVRNSDSTVRDPLSILQAGEFKLQASGGQPPYIWTVKGDLPPGLELSEGGVIGGVVADWAPLETYKFVVRARDAKGVVAEKPLSIQVKERPNKWYEQSRLVSLIHSPEFLEEQNIDRMVELMKRQGFQVAMPISYNNGELGFRWPSKFAHDGTKDTIGKFKEAIERRGMTFGMYMGNLNLEGDRRSRFLNAEQHHMLEEALRRYQPKALWFDWAGVEAEAVDSLYSMVRSIDPEIVIIINGSNRGTFGDWDEFCFEGWGAWGWNMWKVWPVEVPWPKKNSPESWRLLTEPGIGPGLKLLPHGPALNGESDWQEYMRVQLALIGEGFVANIDHTFTLRYGKGWNQPDEVPPVTYEEAPLIKYHEKMAEWASPTGKPPLYPSYTQVNPGPLGAATWGYNLINVDRNVIYLHLLKNPKGKTGMPTEKSISVGPVDENVESVTWMNEDKPLKFQQQLTSTNKQLAIDLDGVTQDPIDTIIKIQLKKPLPLAVPAQLQSIPAGNLASFKPSRLLGAEGKVILLPSKGNLASYGNDGDPSTSAVGGGQWAWIYEVDLGRVYPLKKLAVTFGERGFATESEVLVSDDGINWSVAGSNQRVDPGREEFEIPVTDARFIRVEALKPDGPNQAGIQMSVSELEAYE